MSESTRGYSEKMHVEYYIRLWQCPYILMMLTLFVTYDLKKDNHDMKVTMNITLTGHKERYLKTGFTNCNNLL